MPLLEEISDSENIDDMDFDLAEFDPNLRTAIAPKLEKTIVRSQDIEEAEALAKAKQQQEQLFPDVPEPDNTDVEDVLMSGVTGAHTRLTEEQISYIKHMQIIYPCYFDLNRSHAEGRRVSKQYAVENPLTLTILEACEFLNVNVVHEPEKTHPQDFSNPGRVRVNLKYEGKEQHALIGNKRLLMNKIGEYLQKHPTSLDTVQKMTRHIPAELKGLKVEKLPKVKGFKMNEIVPLHSRFTMKHPATKSLYDQLEAPEIPQINNAAANAQQQAGQGQPKLKNKFMHVRR
ncbi:hypothetical protein WICPIJ_000435 [Wickerhamomyces pijperi]|uniref:Signal recognition particle SEC65 subunit n=1 Tax=Wickerhamomyces pijperi TaxID=599730 RepID=A0A9P8TRV0_WICPI|nr:hypothetical protein WICPIJ_000435 [Wickerhamomyces pijperi]